jgi:hypothetical protein
MDSALTKGFSTGSVRTDETEIPRYTDPDSAAPAHCAPLFAISGRPAGEALHDLLAWSE